MLKRMQGNIKEDKGITLVALVITIVVLIILATVSINTVFGENGLIERASSIAFISDMRKYEEDVEIEIMSRKLADTQLETPNISVGLEGQEGIKTIIPGIATKYENEVIVQINIMYYKYSGTKDSKKRVKWCFQYGIPVWGYDSYEDFLKENEDDTQTDIGDITPTESEYKKIGNVYMQTPDLSNLEVKATYYVTYENGVETIAGRIDRIEAPENWYNYENKEWANIVTVNNSDVSYWTWIPRYAYQTDSTGQTVDAKFISKDNRYRDTNGEEKSIEGYNIPEAFTFGGQELGGYWISKYEVSESLDDICMTNTIDNQIYVTSSKVVKNGSTESYTVYVDGIKTYTGILPYTLENVKSGKTYDIMLINSAGRIVGRKQQASRTNKSIITVDMASLNPEATYYVTYDSLGNNPKISHRIDKGPAPKDWYDYDKNKWANIVTVTNNQVTYWTWIPRYEYIAYGITQKMDIKFIDVSQTEADYGYSIPESFTFEGQELPGYWISKYEVSESVSPNDEFLNYTTTKNSITITTNNPTGNYGIYLNGEEIYTGTLPYTIGNLNENETYDIMLRNEGTVLGRKKINLYNDNITIDLSGLDKNNTYYVYWDADGTEHSDIPISEPAPTGWYNYQEKKWANVVTKANGLITYWTYIPRYEYIAEKGGPIVDIHFISTEQTEPNFGYKIPEAFTFAGKAIPGYWISKYEISESE